EAARWTSDNLDRLPLDPVSMVLDDTGAPPPAPRSIRPPPQPAPPVQKPERPPATAAVAPSIEFTCVACASRLRVPAEYARKQVRCPTWQLVIPVPSRNEAP